MKIAVVGDIMVDRSVFVKAKKICTEAPIPVFEEVGEEWSLGGAAGVAAMCKALSAEVLLCGVIGDGDHGSDGDIVESLCFEKEITHKIIRRG